MILSYFRLWLKYCRKKFRYSVFQGTIFISCLILKLYCNRYLDALKLGFSCLCNGDKFKYKTDNHVHNFRTQIWQSRKCLVLSCHMRDAQWALPIPMGVAISSGDAGRSQRCECIASSVPFATQSQRICNAFAMHTRHSIGFPFSYLRFFFHVEK